MKNLLNSEIELFNFFELTPDLVCVAGKDGYFKKVNPSVLNKLGYTLEEIFAHPIDFFIHPDDRALTQNNRKALLEGKALLNFINRYQTKNGEPVWLEWTSIYFADSEVVFAIAKDVSERKKIEKEVAAQFEKYKKLATNFKNNLEKDKKCLAYELHDQLAQLACAVNFDINWLSKNIPDKSDKINSKVDHALAVSKLMIQTLQRISFSTSPKILEDLGLNAALEWLCKEFSILNGLSCEFIRNYDEAPLSIEIKLDIFRICQEALSNTLDLKFAKNIKINITEQRDKILLSIQDEGNGFDITNEKQTDSIANLQDRVTSINGQLEIKNNSGTGISILLAK